MRCRTQGHIAGFEEWQRDRRALFVPARESPREVGRRGHRRGVCRFAASHAPKLRARLFDKAYDAHIFYAAREGSLSTDPGGSVDPRPRMLPRRARACRRRVGRVAGIRADGPLHEIFRTSV